MLFYDIQFWKHAHLLLFLHLIFKYIKSKQHYLCLKKIYQDIFIDSRNTKPNQTLSQLEKLIIAKL